MNGRESALEALGEWLRANGGVGATDEAAWNLTEYRGVFVAAPAGGRRSNTVYVIGNGVVRPCITSSGSLDDVCDEVIAAGK
ncbi:hypothetical protein [Leifsonia sp. TF02-11]|uniref:hypothetical protein n=1 Tax=Leifsonia sp. TF02-11 TaxID=2815212 RepID=UPI001AA0F82B|nr:hypothetical protein [Leifsonia sp. TF02-11]MBO1741401.1 hypothetical protein [Leifsonia sp. TF02-11]